MLRILIPILVLGGLAFLIVAQAQSGGGHDSHLPKGDVSNSTVAVQADGPSGEESSGTTDIDPGQRAAGIVDVAPPPKPRDPEPFIANDDFLLPVRDGAIDASGAIINERLPSEEAGIAYLLHRQRSGLPIPIAPNLPQWPDGYLNGGDALRGQRCTMDLEILREPMFHAIDPNPSGVEHYYTVFGLDSDQHYHRIVFAESSEHVGSGSRIRVTADYLRLHYYVDDLGRQPAVPMWVTYEVEKAPVPNVTPHWDPVVWVAGIGAFGVLVVWMSVSLSGGMRRTPTRRFKRRSREE